MLAGLSYWWDYIVLRTFMTVDWLESFRASQETFHFLCQKLGPVIQCENTQLHNAVPLNNDKQSLCGAWQHALYIEQ